MNIHVYISVLYLDAHFYISDFIYAMYQNYVLWDNI